jgi:hypothetical protein
MRLLKIFTVLAIVGCVAFSLPAQERVLASGQPEQQETSRSVAIFPNPAVEYVHVRLEQVPANELSVSLHNIIGNEISVETEVLNEHEIRVRVKDLDAGYYLIALRNDKTNFRGTYKFVKK